ncbi:MAG: hypothetical protein AAB445_02885 [Patescibacteria group bacterium]
MPKQKNLGFSDFEKAAMQNRAKELVAEARAGKNRAQGERDVQAAIAKMVEPDKSMAKRLHALITKTAPTLLPKTWYGMPAYAKGEKVVCFFQAGSKFKTRYASLGFSDTAKLDDGPMWPVAFALKKLGAAEEAQIANLLKKAVK